MLRYLKAYHISIDRPPYAGGENVLEIDSEQITPLRIVFQVNKRYSQNNTANTMSLTIYNLGLQTRQRFSGYGDIVTLRAGYSSDGNSQLSTLFRGFITLTHHDVQQPNVMTHIQCLDGDAGSFSRFDIAPAISQPAPIRDIIDELAAKAGIPVAYNNIPSDLVLPEYTFDNRSYMDTIAELANRADATARVEDGQLYVTLNGEAPALGSIIVREETGMIGFPTKFANTRLSPFWASAFLGRSAWKVRTQLNGDLRIQRIISITCPNMDVYDQSAMILALQHSGDSYGDQWETVVETLEIIN